MNKQSITVQVRPLGADEIDDACADAQCFLTEVQRARDAEDTRALSAAERAQAARWLAERALALALHFEGTA